MNEASHAANQVTPYLYLLPMVLLLVFTFGYPLVAVFDFSLRRIRGASGPFIGLENYRQVFKDDVFHRRSAQCDASARRPDHDRQFRSCAVMLFERIRGWRFFRSLLFVPLHPGCAGGRGRVQQYPAAQRRAKRGPAAWTGLAGAGLDRQPAPDVVVGDGSNHLARGRLRHRAVPGAPEEHQ